MAKGTIPGTVRVDHASVTGPGGVALNKADNPASVSLAWEAQQPAVQKARDVYGGTAAMQAAGARYLAQFPEEEDDAYGERLERARLYNMFRATVDGLTDMVWRKPSEWAEDVPEEIWDAYQNVDLQGSAIDVFAREGFREKMTVGHVHYFVDWHSPTNAPANAQQEKDARPYATQISKDQLIRFRTESRDGRPVLIRFAYIAEDVVEDGEFAEKAIHRVREYSLVGVTAAGSEVGAPEGNGAPQAVGPNGRRREQVKYRSWTRDATADSKTEWAPEETGRMMGNRMTEIPLVTDYSGRTGFLTSEPPLMDLVEENIEHWQIRSERRQSLGIAGIAVMLLTGVAKKDVETVAVGPSIGLVLPEGADGKYLETTGAALEQYRQELQDIERRATSLGLSMLQSQKRVAETAQAMAKNQITEQSKLAAQANQSSVALRELTRLFALWMGLDWEPDESTVEVNTDFDTEPLTPQEIAELRAMVSEDQLTLQTLWQILVEGEVLPKTFDAEDEEGRLNAATARRVAEVQAQMDAAEQRARAQGGGPVEIQYGEDGRPARLVPQQQAAQGQEPDQFTE